MELKTVIKLRKSVRHYLKRPVSRDDLRLLIEAAHAAPSSCNLQLNKYIIIDNLDLLERLGRLVSSKFIYSPACIVVLYDKRFTVERHSGITSCGMASENILLKAVDLGLSTCVMAGFSKDKIIKDILGIPDSLDILVIISVGYEDKSVYKHPVFKLPLEQIFSFNHYDNLPLLDDKKDFLTHSISTIKMYRERISSVYLDRFRLNSFNEKYYKLAVAYCENAVLSLDKNSVNWLDIVTHDGYFMKLWMSFIKRESLSSRYHFIISDYLPNNLDFFEKVFSCKTVVIDDTNRIDLVDNSIDFASFIFQADFTPKLEDLLKNTSHLLKGEGLLFVALVEELWYKKIIKYLFTFLRSILGKLNNIYEGNVYYKIGPKRNLNYKSFSNLAVQYDLKEVDVKKKRFWKDGVTVYLATFNPVKR